MTIKSTSAQYALHHFVEFTYADLPTATFVPFFDLPANAVPIGGLVNITTAWNTGTSAALSVGKSGTANKYFSAIDLKASAVTMLTTLSVTQGSKLTALETVGGTATLVGTAATAGAGHIRFSYVVAGRSNEVQS